MLTNSRDALIERADIVFECSGDTAHAAEVLCAAGAAGRHLVTLNAEAQVTVGTELLHRGFSVTEAYGDQPGALAELDEEVRAIGFEPVAYVNFKGFHDPDPSPESMRYWSQKQASTVRAVTSYTDGGKLQIEQVLVANGLDAGIARQGMIGGAVDDLLDLDHLALAAERLGRPVSDYIVHPKGPKGVLILATCEICRAHPRLFGLRQGAHPRRPRLHAAEAALLRAPRGAEDAAPGGRRRAAADHQRPRADRR